MSATDTIFALASGSGPAALAVVRISGPRSRDALIHLAEQEPKPRYHQTVILKDPATHDIIDQCVAVWLPGPKTFTGEDSVEFFIHAGRATISSLLKALGELKGFRLAEPGEFTRRAFLNGKMDLVEAEGLGDLLAARTALQKKQALGQMLGRASHIYEAWRRRLVEIRAGIEAVLDFADEAGVAEAALPGIDLAIAELLSEMTNEVAQSDSAMALRDGVRVVLAGLPNTGKSSVLNILARRDAAIVSPVPGTTRDTIEVQIDLGGVPVLISDTAGLRDSADIVEQEGIRRSRNSIAQADVVVWVAAPDVSGSTEVDPNVEPDIVIWNKSDIKRHGGEAVIPAPVSFSAKTGAGITELLQTLEASVSRYHTVAESSVVTNARQNSAIRESIRLLNDSLEYDEAQLEMKAHLIQLTAHQIARVTGHTDVEEWLGEIFSRFCIGK